MMTQGCPGGSGRKGGRQFGSREPDLSAPAYITRIDRAVAALPEEWRQFARLYYCEGPGPIDRRRLSRRLEQLHYMVWEALSDRIKRARERAAFTKSELARRVGVRAATAIQWELPKGTKGAKNPSIKNLINIALVTGVSFEWLATARGEMVYLGQERGRAINEHGAMYGIATEDERALLEIFRSIPAKKQKALLLLLNN